MNLDCIQKLAKNIYKMDHPSGFKIYIYNKKGFKSAYVAIGTSCGSIYTRFNCDNKEYSVPLGSAHFLEHQMFESQGEGIFKRFAKTGAIANAYTSFDRTVYHFTGINQLENDIFTLLDLVRKPQYTTNSIAKERGIIEQEIKMYRDIPEHRLFYNILNCLYGNSIVQPIEGSVDSISKITKEDLDHLHKTFYADQRLAMVAVGDINPNEFYNFIKDKIKTTELNSGYGIIPTENTAVNKHESIEQLHLPIPMFCLGYKEHLNYSDNAGRRMASEEMAATDLMLRALAGRTSKLYQDLIESNLVTEESFSAKCLEGPGFITILFEGQSKDPEACIKKIKKHISDMKSGSTEPQLFELAQKDLYGEILTGFDDLETIGDMLIDSHFANRDLIDYINFLGGTNIYNMVKNLQRCYLNDHNSATAIIY